MPMILWLGWYENMNNLFKCCGLSSICTYIPTFDACVCSFQVRFEIFRTGPPTIKDRIGNFNFTTSASRTHNVSSVQDVNRALSDVTIVTLNATWEPHPSVERWRHKNDLTSAAFGLEALILTELFNIWKKERGNSDFGIWFKRGGL